MLVMNDGQIGENTQYSRGEGNDKKNDTRKENNDKIYTMD
jgi:hypothetical protein